MSADTSRLGLPRRYGAGCLSIPVPRPGCPARGACVGVTVEKPASSDDSSAAGVGSRPRLRPLCLTKRHGTVKTSFMSTEADEVTKDLIEGMALLASGVPGGYQERGDGVVLNVIGLASASTNAVHILEPAASLTDARRFVERLQRADLPFVLRVRPGTPDWVADLAVSSGLERRIEFPIMRMAPAASARADDGQVIVEVDPGDADLVGRVTAAFTAGNEVPAGIFDPLVAPAMFDRLEVAVYAALDGDTVTSVGIRLQVPGAVGVFGVATPPEHRRRGLGKAITSRVVTDGVAAGARTAFLGATPMGYGIYERLGFRTVETWTFHVPGQ